MIEQVITHELGHVLGLGHNFNSAEHSVMDYSDYSDQVDLSDYDRDALLFVFKPSVKVKHVWVPLLKPAR
jgi:predicted Zn-dependent protease